MRRRRFLQSLGIGAGGLGGCIIKNSNDSTSGKFQNRIVTIEKSGFVPNSSISVSITSASSEANSNSPATIETVLENKGQERLRLTLPCRSILHYPLYDSENSYFLITSDYDFERVNTCWERAGGSTIHVDNCQTVIELAPGDSWSSELELWSTADTRCMPTGSFEFSDSLTFLRDDPDFIFSLSVTKA